MINNKLMYNYFTRTHFGIFGLLLFLSGCKEKENFYNSWHVYKGDKTSSSYSALNQINRNNVNQLKVAWTYRTGDLKDDHPRTGIETNPIIVDDVLYGASPHLKIFAIDATTGSEHWKFDPFKNDESGGKLRSVVYKEVNDEGRILFTAGTWLYALDAERGKLIPSFGQGGKVSLNKGLGRDPDSISVRNPSPGIIYNDLLILGSKVSPDYGSAPGDIRAYDVKTGQIVWTFHTIPKSGEKGFGTWGGINSSTPRRGGANNWAGMSLDQKRGIVYIPTGSPNYDFYGGNRPGKNLYSNSLLALNAATGERIWHYQIIHHGLWDYDLPAPPNLVTVKKDGKKIDAVAQVTKQGFTFLFNRVTGEPIFPIEEKPVPQSRVKNEQTWPTQPFPTKPEPIVRQHYTNDDIPDRSPKVRDSVKKTLDGLRNEGLFTPPDPRGSVVFPRLGGAANWGGAAYDPKSNILFVNAKERVAISTIKEVNSGKVTSGMSSVEKGKVYYEQSCATCHGMNLEGQPPAYPALSKIKQRSSEKKVRNRIENGGSRMPAFSSLSEVKKDAIVTYLYSTKELRTKEKGLQNNANRNGMYRDMTAHSRFEGPDGYPAVKPPWGTLNAIDLNSGKLKWKVPLGKYPELNRKGISPTGRPSWGGPIVTAGDLIFIGGTGDKKFRAYSKETGKLLWETTLPAAGFATPATYKSGRRQYVVIAAGGGRGTEPGDYYVAFALPNSK